MVLAKKCCFCISLQVGCVTIAFVGLFLSGMNIDYIMFLLNRTYKREASYKFSAQVLHACLQIVPELFSICASFLLILAVLSRYFCVFWAALVFQALQPVYLILYSIISSAMDKNIIVNVSFWHNITYWVYVVIWLAMSLYFMYISYSYYRQLKEGETENIV